jgi:hypothetical protein
METYSALREYRKRVAAMLDDPECTGDLLALGISLLDFAILRIDTDEKSWSYYGGRAWGAERHGYMVRDVLRRDIRRYDAIKDASARDPARRCGAPMVRRQGPCGNSAGRRALLTDPDTGRKQWIAACSRHVDWFDGRVRSNRAQCEVETITIPAANAGGVLARHIPEIDWPATWRKLDPNWTPPPEGVDEPTGVKPKLTLVMGGD